MSSSKRRLGARASPLEDEGSYLASVSDLMSGLLFVFMIALMVFVLSLVEQEKRKAQEVKRLKGADEAREELLQELQDLLTREGVEIAIDSKQGVLRLKEGVLFQSGSADLGAEGDTVVGKIGTALADVLPCYTHSDAAPRPNRCPERSGEGLMDALFIEGHTDDRPLGVGKEFRDNWELSTARARSVYLSLTSHRPGLDGLRNGDSQAILTVSGYADRRGVAPNDTDENRRKNRRIDLRFVLSPPREATTPPVAEVRERLAADGVK